MVTKSHWKPSPPSLVGTGRPWPANACCVNARRRSIASDKSWVDLPNIVHEKVQRMLTVTTNGSIYLQLFKSMHNYITIFTHPSIVFGLHWFPFRNPSGFASVILHPWDLHFLVRDFASVSYLYAKFLQPISLQLGILRHRSLRPRSLRSRLLRPRSLRLRSLWPTSLRPRSLR